MPNEYNSRRRFLMETGSMLGMLLIPWDSLKFEDFVSKDIFEKGILFSREEIPRIRKNTQLPFFKDYWQSVINADLKADIKFLKEELNIRRHFQNIFKADEILKRTALASLLENKKEQEDVARLAIEKIHSFEDWDYFTEGGKDIIGLQCAPDATISFILAYDWMKDKLSKADKDDMLKAIAEKGVKPCYLSVYGMKHPDKVKGWAIDPKEDYKAVWDLSKWPVILSTTNLKIVPTAALLMGSFAVADRYPESKKWIELGIGSMKEFSSMWKKDGTYYEGYSYSGYSTIHMIHSINILQKALNVNHDNLVNFVNYSRYILHMSAPFKNNPFGCINFGDAAFSVESPLLFWIAGRFKDGITQYTAEKFPSRINVFSVAWYDDSVKIKVPTQDLFDVKLSNDWVISRTGWSENDTVLAFRSGGPVNHEHADRNSIILNAFGERFFNDPLGAAYQNTDKLWLLRQTSAHTSVLIDGKGHEYIDGTDGTNASKASSKITQYKPGKEFTVVSSDATHGYRLVNDDIKKVQRTVVFVKPDILIVIDDLEKEKIDSKLQARFQVFNTDGKAEMKVLPESDSFEIQRPSARLFAKVESNLKFTISDLTLDIPAEKGIFPFIEVSSEPSKKCLLVTACAMAPVSENKNPEISINSSGNHYQIKIQHRNKSIYLDIQIKDKYPVIKLKK